MPISIRAISRRRRPTDRGSAGFTLVELMVVVAILAVLSAVVVMSIPDPNARLTEDADRFAARAAAARDAAVVQATPMSIWVSPSGYGFARRVEGRWMPIEDKPFVTTDWRGGAAADVMTAGPSRIIFDTTGAAASPLAVTLRRGSRAATVTLGADGAVKVG